MNRCIAPLLFLLFISFYNVKGQDYIVNYRHLSLSDGISHQQVHCFLQDRHGLMWIGTQFGLNRFDGNQFEIWTKVQDSLSSNQINYLLEDEEGWIWAITTGDKYSTNDVRHISLIHSLHGEVQRFEDKFASNAPFEISDITHFFSTPQRALYFWAKNLLWKYDPLTGFQLHACPETVSPFVAAGEIEIWGTTPNAVVRFNKDGHMLDSLPYSFNQGNKRLLGDHTGAWLLEYQSPLTYFPVRNTIASTKTTPNYLSKKESYFDKRRQWLWYTNKPEVLAFDTLGKKVFDFRTLTGKHFDIMVTNFYVDQKGLIWLATRDGFYVMELRDKHFKKYLHNSQNKPTTTKNYQCRGILEHEGQLFINSYQGSVRIDLEQGTVTPLKRPQSFPISRLHFSFHKTPEGRIWSLSNYISEIDGKTGQILEDIEIPGSDYAIRGIHTDKNSTSWLGTGAGLSIIKDQIVYPFLAYNGFTSLEKARVFCIHETSDDNLWLGTNRGLYTLDPKEGIVDHFWSDGKGENYLPATKIQHIHEDEEGNFWMSTELEGLIRWNPDTKQIKQFTRAEGMPTNTIYAVYQDQKGFLWMSSNFGLIQMDKKTFRKKVYLEEDGISNLEFNRFSHFQAEDGRIYFGGQNGVTAFYPEDFWENWYKDEQSELQVYRFIEGHNFGVEKIEALHKLRDQKLLEYPHNVRTLSFKILSPDFFLADKISYYYRVKPHNNAKNNSFSGDWLKSESSTVNVLGLTPGRYEVDIEARVLDKERVGRPLTYHIHITQPFFKIWYFWVIIGGVILCSFLGYLRFRSYKKKQQKHLLEQKEQAPPQQVLKDKQINDQQEEKMRPLDSLLNKADQRWTDELDEVMRQNLGNLNLSIADIADEMNLSRSQFFRKIKTITGLTPNQYLQEIRLNEAKRLFESGEYTTIKAVSLSVGFKKPSYFSALFKDRFGFSPSNYFNQN